MLEIIVVITESSSNILSTASSQLVIVLRSRRGVPQWHAPGASPVGLRGASGSACASLGLYIGRHYCFGRLIGGSGPSRASGRSWAVRIGLVFLFWVFPASVGSAGLCPGCFSAAPGRLVLLFWASPVPDETEGGVNSMPSQAAKREDFTSRGLALF